MPDPTAQAIPFSSLSTAEYSASYSCNQPSTTWHAFLGSTSFPYAASLHQRIQNTLHSPRGEFDHLFPQEMAKCSFHAGVELNPSTCYIQQTRCTDTVPGAIRTNWQQLARARLTVKTYRYLLKLASKDHGWRGEGSLPMNPRSLTTFLHLWNLVNQDLPEPEFVLMPNGNLQAEWYKDDHHFIELEFQPGDNIIFGIFDGQTIMEGVTNIKEVVQLLNRPSFKRSKTAYDRQAA
jgi:hypothetical protein